MLLRLVMLIFRLVLVDSDCISIAVLPWQREESEYLKNSMTNYLTLELSLGYLLYGLLSVTTNIILSDGPSQCYLQFCEFYTLWIERKMIVVNDSFSCILQYTTTVCTLLQSVGAPLWGVGAMVVKAKEAEICTEKVSRGLSGESAFGMIRQ